MHIDIVCPTHQMLMNRFTLFDWKVDMRLDSLEIREEEDGETHSVPLQAEPLLETKLTAPSRVTDAMTMVGDEPLVCCWSRSRCWPKLLPLAL